MNAERMNAYKAMKVFEECLDDRDGTTSAEIAERLGIGRKAVTMRLKAIEEVLGWVRKDGYRRVGGRGSDQTSSWTPIWRWADPGYAGTGCLMTEEQAIKGESLEMIVWRFGFHRGAGSLGELKELVERRQAEDPDNR